MSNEFNDVILEDLAEEILTKIPDISDENLKIAVDKAFDALPEPDIKGD